MASRTYARVCEVNKRHTRPRRGPTPNHPSVTGARGVIESFRQHPGPRYWGCLGVPSVTTTGVKSRGSSMEKDVSRDPLNKSTQKNNSIIVLSIDN